MTPPATTSGVHSLITCLRSNGVLGGTGDGKGQITSTTDLWLTLGWGATTGSQINNFFGAEFGSIVVSSYDESTQAIGAPVAQTSWGTPGSKKETDVSDWTAPVVVHDPTLNGGAPFSQTKFFWNVGPLPSGTYWVAPDFELTKTVFDGAQGIPAGPWFNTGCELVVG